MNALIIVEYNPLHNGHIYHINQTKQLLDNMFPQEENSVIAVMSGNFTQRGDISVLNKYTRATHAIKSGVDMVVELPTIYATSSAEYFANGAMQIASKIKDLALICFGSECDDFSTLQNIADLNFTAEYNTLIKYYMKSGISYPKANELAIQNMSKIDTNLINMPNNILGIEYIKQAKKLNINAKLTSIKRIGNGYNEDSLDGKFNSSKSIRVALDEGKTEFKQLKIPQYVYEDLLNYHVDNNKLLAIIANNCLTIKEVYEDTEGVVNRIKKFSQQAHTYQELVDLAHTKRYTKSKIKRILLHIALSHSADNIQPIGKPNILAVKGNKKSLLSMIDMQGDLIATDMNYFANSIYNIVSKDKILSEKMLIID